MQDYYAEALRRIEEAKITQATVLHLSSLKLTHVPPEITTLPHLIHLYLSENHHLTDICAVCNCPPRFAG